MMAVTNAEAFPDAPRGDTNLPPPLMENELAEAPVLKSRDQLIISDMTDDEFDIFFEAVLS